MDPGKLEYYEFLDLSDIDENERQQLKQTLFSESTPDFLQLPWTNPNFATEEWQKEPYDDEPQQIPNGPLEPVCSGSPALVADPNRVIQAVPPHIPAVTMYSQPPPTAYTMQPPSTGYQHPQNVFVSNVTANVNLHGYMTGHYVQQPYTITAEPADIPGRSHRGRSRGRGNKRIEVDTTATAPGYSQPFVPIHYPTAYYTQQVGSPMQHPTAQHATGSPLYIAPVYPTMYGAYQYYPPPGAQQMSAEMAEMYQQQPSEDDYQSPPELVPTTVIVNSNIDSVSSIKPADEVEIASASLSSVTISNTSVDTIKTESNTTNIVADGSASSVIVTNISNKQPTTIVTPVPNANLSETKSEPSNAVVTLPPKNQQVALNDNNKIESAPVHNNVRNTIQHQPEIVDNNNSVVVKSQSQQQQQSIVQSKTEQEIVVNAQQTNVSSTTPPAPSGKSWASLFNKASSPTATNSPIQNDAGKALPKPLAFVSPFSKSSEEKPAEKMIDDASLKISHANLSALSNDPASHRMGEFLSKYYLDNRTVSLQPRGLTNRSNYCYINSILQALLACPPFYNLLKALPHQPRKNANGKSSTPIIDSMIEFVNEFTPLSAESRLNRKEKVQRKDNNIDVICGISFEPSRIYKILNGIRTDTFIVEGRQEDAEEFFGCLLNGLNDEMLELTKLVEGQNNNNQNLSNGDIATNGDAHDTDEVEWKVMGAKNKGSITRRADFGRTPISDIFRGQLRSRVHRTGDQITDNVQPFFTLQLDIEKANSVYEALEMLVNKDKLEGVTCSRTNQQVEAWQQVTIEELPLVMVLHLKCFNYKLDACSKIIKALEFPIDLKIDAKLLSSKAKYSGKQKQYKLFAVVYHDGKEATKGHYLTDAYHVGYGGWVRYDDATVKSVQESNVLHPNAARVPYLLFYRRCDTIGNQQQQQQNAAKRE